MYSSDIITGSRLISRTTAKPGSPVPLKSIRINIVKYALPCLALPPTPVPHLTSATISLSVGVVKAGERQAHPEREKKKKKKKFKPEIDQVRNVSTMSFCFRHVNASKVFEKKGQPAKNNIGAYVVDSRVAKYVLSNMISVATI